MNDQIAEKNEDAGPVINQYDLFCKRAETIAAMTEETAVAIISLHHQGTTKETLCNAYGYSKAEIEFILAPPEIGVEVRNG